MTNHYYWKLVEFSLQANEMFDKLPDDSISVSGPTWDGDYFIKVYKDRKVTLMSRSECQMVPEPWFGEDEYYLTRKGHLEKWPIIRGGMLRV